MALRRFDAGSSSSSRSRSPRPQSSSYDDCYSVSTSNSTSDSESEPQPVVNIANLMISQLTSFHDGEELDEDGGHKNSINGRCPKRLAEVLKEKCGGGCRRNCCKLLRYQRCVECVKLFWSLKKTAQDCLLWSIQQCGASELFLLAVL